MEGECGPAWQLGALFSDLIAFRHVEAFMILFSCGKVLLPKPDFWSVGVFKDYILFLFYFSFFLFFSFFFSPVDPSSSFMSRKDEGKEPSTKHVTATHCNQSIKIYYYELVVFQHKLLYCRLPALVQARLCPSQGHSQHCARLMDTLDQRASPGCMVEHHEEIPKQTVYYFIHKNKTPHLRLCILIV